LRLLAIGLLVLVVLSPRSAISEEKAKEPIIIVVPESKELKGLGFGVGIGLTFDLHRNNRIGEAALVDGRVRITESSDVIAGFVFESHYFFPFAPNLPGLPAGIPAMGHGPFAAIEVGSTSAGGSGVITAYALGGWLDFASGN
jgi:hypothetical protein